MTQLSESWVNQAPKRLKTLESPRVATSPNEPSPPEFASGDRGRLEYPDGLSLDADARIKEARSGRDHHHPCERDVCGVERRGGKETCRVQRVKILEVIYVYDAQRAHE